MSYTNLRENIPDLFLDEANFGSTLEILKTEQKINIVGKTKYRLKSSTIEVSNELFNNNLDNLNQVFGDRSDRCTQNLFLEDNQKEEHLKTKLRNLLKQIFNAKNNYSGDRNAYSFPHTPNKYCEIRELTYEQILNDISTSNIYIDDENLLRDLLNGLLNSEMFEKGVVKFVVLLDFGG